jgi:hypothetical protein
MNSDKHGSGKNELQIADWLTKSALIFFFLIFILKSTIGNSFAFICVQPRLILSGKHWLLSVFICVHLWFQSFSSASSAFRFASR